MLIGDKNKHAVNKKLETLTGKKDSKVDLHMSDKVKNVSLGQNIYIVVESVGLEDGLEVFLNVKQGKEKYLHDLDASFSFLESDSQTTEFTVKIADHEMQLENTVKEQMLGTDRLKGYTIDYDHNKKFTDKINDGSKEYKTSEGTKVKSKRSLVEINLKTKDKNQNDDWDKKLKEAIAYLYIKALIKDKEVKYKGNKDDKTKLNNLWSNAEADLIKFRSEILIKRALDLNFKSKKDGHGHCAHFTYNHAYNYVQLLKGNISKLVADAFFAAGGNARDEGYHNELKKLGYTLEVDNADMDNADLEKELAGNFDIGDVVVYWTIDNKLKWESPGKYGHTQIFTDGLQTDSDGNKWATDNPTNYRSFFVYGKWKAKKWHYKKFKAPTS